MIAAPAMMPDRWAIAALAVIGVQLLAAPMAEPYVDTISAGMAVLAILCALRTAQLTPPIGSADRRRWQAGTLAWSLWAAQWVANAVQDSLLSGDQLLAKGLSELRLAALIVALAPLAAQGDDRRLRWIDTLFAVVFALLMTLLSWPDLLDPEPGGPDKTFLYLGYIAMAVFAGLSVLGQSARPLRRMSLALFVTLASYAVVGISTRELIERGWLGVDAPVFAYGDLPFVAYLCLIGRPLTPVRIGPAATSRTGMLLSRLVPLALTILIVALAFLVAYSMRDVALAAGIVALVMLVAYAARTALTEALHDADRQAALDREQARSAGLTDLMHELRSPLGSMAINASIMRRVGDTIPAAGRAAGAIESSCMTISRLLDDVLALERLEAGLLPSSPARHDVATLLRDVVTTLSAEAEEYGVVLDARVEPVAAVIDATALQRVVLNLVNNALRFTPRGGRVEVALERRDGRIVVTVADTGTGLDPAVRDRPFRRFSSVARPLNGRRGSGLGLAICDALVRSMGGSIVVDPSSNIGTTFRIILPDALY